MSNTRRSKADREMRKNRLKCPKCKGHVFQSKEYDDAFVHVCTRCSFPQRVLKSETRQESALAHLQTPRWWEKTDG